jgi:hypothetical protein
MKLYCLGCLSLVAFTACVQTRNDPPQKNQATMSATKPQPSVVAPGTPSNDSPVIGYLEQRGQTITIKAGLNGPVYSARTSDGRTLFENLSLKQLSAQSPEIHELLNTSVADNSKEPTPFDARVRPSR